MFHCKGSFLHSFLGQLVHYIIHPQTGVALTLLDSSSSSFGTSSSYSLHVSQVASLTYLSEIFISKVGGVVIGIPRVLSITRFLLADRGSSFGRHIPVMIFSALNQNVRSSKDVSS
jgi:hypothetical protein